MQNTGIKVAIVDDHQIVIDGIFSMLKDYAEISIVASTTSPLAILETLNNCTVDVLITDVFMPDMDGRELSRRVREKFPNIKILALSMSGQGHLVDAMISESNIAGYLLKTVNKEELLAAIRKIHGGGICFSEEVLLELTNFDEVKKENDAAHLTLREIEIIQLIEKELTNKDIADKLFISERTVETHRKNIFRKTGVNTILGIVKYAHQHKLLAN